MFEEEAENYAREWGTTTDDSYACLKDGFKEGVKTCKTAADEIIRDLLCLLVDFKEQIIFNEDLQKIKKAEDFLNN